MVEENKMTNTSVPQEMPTNDRQAVAYDVYKLCLQAEASGNPMITLVGIRMHGCSPLRTGDNSTHTYAIADILASLRKAGGYTKDLESFRAGLGVTHGKEAKNNDMIVPKRFYTSVNSLYRAFGRKDMNSVLRATHGQSWWETDKNIRQESLILRVLDNDGEIPAAESAPTQGVVPNNSHASALMADFEAVFDAHANQKVAVNDPTFTVMAVEDTSQPVNIQDILDSLAATGTAVVPTANLPTPLTIESTKAELAAVVAEKHGIDVAQASLMNKATLLSMC